MRYEPIDKSLFVGNRKRFKKAVPEDALCVFQSNDILPTNADGTHKFVQNSNLFWLTGIDQEETICLLFTGASREEYREVLFVRKTSKHLETWEGHKLTKEEARKISGIETVYWTSSFRQVFQKLMAETDLVMIPSPRNAKNDLDVQDRNLRFAKWCMEKFPLHRYRDASPVIHKLRAVKSPVEIELMRKACEITEAGFRRILQFVKPGVWEYEIEAEYAHAFIRRKARGFAYEPIIGSGESSCILHYIANNQQCKSGDVLLMDVGACYANYAADMTRTIPVNGTFSPRQRAVYEAVLRCLYKARALLSPGRTLKAYNEEVAHIVEKELVDLGLLSTAEISSQDPKNPAYKKYFMHNTSHSIGLDVHDVGIGHQVLEPGMVLTCEPGIYIRAEGIGIRLENNILITTDGNEDLMSSIPVDASEIESLMRKG